MPTLLQAASESVVFMLMDVETVAAEEENISMAEVVSEDVEEEVDDVEEDTSKEVVWGAAAHTTMKFTYHMLPVTLMIESGPQSQTIQGKVSLRTRYTQSSW